MDEKERHFLRERCGLKLGIGISAPNAETVISYVRDVNQDCILSYIVRHPNF